MLGYAVRWGSHALLFPTNNINKLPEIPYLSEIILEALVDSYLKR